MRTYGEGHKIYEYFLDSDVCLLALWFPIDNFIADSFIRLLVGERMYSLFFESDKLVRVSAVYHTIISTCKMQELSVLDDFEKLFSEIVKGRRNYENL